LGTIKSAEAPASSEWKLELPKIMGSQAGAWEPGLGSVQSILVPKLELEEPDLGGVQSILVPNLELEDPDSGTDDFSSFFF
jgi:hypothetical protein